uniref:BPTI/Kunitz inhibitor domain-containing protein n=1 Tax=Nothobranchius furzeri TaxID=105023 RepID=A0A8C6PA78_NOTFU
RQECDQGRGTYFSFRNENHFVNERDCLRTCSPNAENTYPLDICKMCHLKPTTGECSGNFLGFYYGSVDGKCKRFLWSGCCGNGNRCFDAESCNVTCAGIWDDRGENGTPLGQGLLKMFSVMNSYIFFLQGKLRSVLPDCSHHHQLHL